MSQDLKKVTLKSKSSIDEKIAQNKNASFDIAF